MGGFGSGRPSGSGRDAVESCLLLDVGLLHKTACLQAGWSGFVQWTRAGKRAAMIGLRAEADCIHLSYRAQIGGGEWEEIAEKVRIVRVACRFGSSRPYFICPGVVDDVVACGRRVAKLYQVGRYFRCRQCHRLAYSSQSEGKEHRARRRANKIRERLGDESGTAAPFPQKPPNMRQSTYERLRNKALDDEITADQMQIERLLAWLNKSGNKREFW
jgi:hypothetical protein